jgi:hypothetical protein
MQHTQKRFKGDGDRRLERQRDDIGEDEEWDDRLQSDARRKQSVYIAEEEEEHVVCSLQNSFSSQ